MRQSNRRLGEVLRLEGVNRREEEAGAIRGGSGLTSSACLLFSISLVPMGCPNGVDKFSISEYHRDDSGDVLIALTRKGLSGGEVPIRDSLAN